MNSLIHILLYANDFDIDGIISTSSTLHFLGDGEHTVGEVIESYASDPDGDELSYNWMVYKDDCAYNGEFLPYLDVIYNGGNETQFVIPKDAASGDYFNKC